MYDNQQQNHVPTNAAIHAATKTPPSGSSQPMIFCILARKRWILFSYLLPEPTEEQEEVKQVLLQCMCYILY